MLIHKTDSEVTALFLQRQVGSGAIFFPEEPVQLAVAHRHPESKASGHHAKNGANVTLINHSMQIWEEV